MVLVQREIKAVYLWETKVRPIDKRTFTISRTEQSNMSSWWTYSDDAAWLTAGDTAFDEFFWYYWCRLNASGVETAKVTQEESWWAWKLDITQLWTLTSGDNVMIAFPVMWIKMSKSWSTVTLSITKELNKSWYQYYAHSTWTLSNPWTPKDVFYLGAYKWYNNSSVLKSWSWKSPTWSLKQSASCTYAQANGTWYNIIWFYQRMYVNALYMMKYGNPNSKSTVWIWYADWYSAPTTWWTNSQTNATYWTTSNTGRVKLFWLEDWWWWINEYVGWAYTDSNKQLYTMLSNRNWELSWWELTWTTISQTWSYTDLSSIAGDNKAMFAPIWTANTSNWSNYYSVYTVVQASRLAMAGGYYQNSTMSGAFNLQFVVSTSSSWGDQGSRLMYLNWLT